MRRSEAPVQYHTRTRVRVVSRHEMTSRVGNLPGIAISYVVANPSSYAYLDGSRTHCKRFAVEHFGVGTGISATAASYSPARVCRVCRRQKLYCSLRHI